jgi:quercetin dioxygenase-like cupin family protein
VIVDLTAGDGRGPLWGDATDDLNLTLLAWPPGEGPGEHVNGERDVVLVVLDGSGTVVLDGHAHEVCAGNAVVVQKGARRGLIAGPDGIRYLTVHRRRGGLQIAPASSGARQESARLCRSLPREHP